MIESWKWEAVFQSSPALKDRCNTSGDLHLHHLIMFQSSPALKDRCNPRVPAPSAGEVVFQSSPALKDRCNAQSWARYVVNHKVSILTGLERPVQPTLWRVASNPTPVFQSSPALKDRCNPDPHKKHPPPPQVSILTGLERPVQRGSYSSGDHSKLCFNPHRP